MQLPKIDFNSPIFYHSFSPHQWLLTGVRVLLICILLACHLVSSSYLFQVLHVLLPTTHDPLCGSTSDST